MSDTICTAPPATQQAALWAGRILSGLFVMFLIPDAAIKLLQMSFVADALRELGYPAGLGFVIGVLEAVFLALYLLPATTVLGAVLFTGLFGGAIASHLRIGSPLLTHVLFGVYLGLFMWGGLWLRDPRLRALLPIRRG